MTPHPPLDQRGVSVTGAFWLGSAVLRCVWPSLSVRTGLLKHEAMLAALRPLNYVVTEALRGSAAQ